MQRPKLTRKFVSSYLKDAIPEYEGILHAAYAAQQLREEARKCFCIT